MAAENVMTAWNSRTWRTCGGTLASLLLLSSCGGGDETSAPSTTTVSPPAAAALPGKLYYNVESMYVELDPASGHATRLFATGIGTRPSHDGLEFTVIRSRSRNRIVYDDQFYGISRDGTVRTHFEKEELLNGPARLSPDGQLIVMDWVSSRRGDPFGRMVPTVFRRNGTIVARFAGYHSYDWTPDNRLVLVRESSFYVTSAELTTPTLLATLSTTTPHDWPQDIEVSPDGTHLAFSRGLQGERDAHLFVMTLDGSSLRQVTRSPANERHPAWSPDGRWLAFQYKGGSGKHAGSDCPLLFAVRADASLAEVNETSDGVAFRLNQIEDNHPHPTCLSGDLAWRPGAQPVTHREGSEFAPDF